MKAARALVVDDDPGILEGLETRLHSMGLDVALARNYQEAVTLLDDGGFDVALFDLRMELSNVLKLMEAARDRQPRLPVLIMSAHETIDNGRVAQGSPLFVGGEAAGALVVETRAQPTADDLDLLAFLSSQAVRALTNARELERLRSGALGALGSMGAQVAHALGNPLGAIKLFAEYLEHRLGTTGDAGGAEVAAKISREVDHMADLVREIAQFGPPESLHRVPIGLNGLLESCLALARARVAGKEIRVALELDPALPQAALDPREMRKVFLNLIVNALEATEAGGTLTLRTRAEERGLVEAAVEDTGCGMTEETRARVFDLFVTTKHSGKGLGMAIARAVVEQHGGRMDIRSQIGRGTLVRVLLPREAA